MDCFRNSAVRSGLNYTVSKDFCVQILLIGFPDYPPADVYFFSHRQRTFSNSRAYLYNFELAKSAVWAEGSANNKFLRSWASSLQQQGYTNEQIVQYQQYYSQYMNQQNAQQWKFQAL